MRPRQAHFRVLLYTSRASDLGHNDDLGKVGNLAERGEPEPEARRSLADLVCIKCRYRNRPKKAARPSWRPPSVTPNGGTRGPTAFRITARCRRGRNELLLDQARRSQSHGRTATVKERPRGAGAAPVQLALAQARYLNVSEIVPSLLMSILFFGLGAPGFASSVWRDRQKLESEVGREPRTAKIH